MSKLLKQSVICIKLLSFWSVSLIVLIGFLLGCFYLFRYDNFVKKMPDYTKFNKTSYKEPVFPELSINQVVNLGWAHTKKQHPKSSYLNYSKDKKPDTVRIGVFGDSLVEGFESANGYDFPYLLQKKFNDQGITNIEVINFGVISYGQHQAFLLWNYLGKEYDLDYTVFFVMGWHKRERDSSFTYVYNDFFPLHARYITEKNNLQLMPIIGKNRLEAIQIYHRMLPPWQYVRYDYKAPMFLRLLLPLNRRLKNPFYYRFFDFDNEQYQLYKLIIDNLQNQAKNLIIMSNDDIVYNFKNEFKSKNVYFFRPQAPQESKKRSSLYIAPRGHKSSLGNDLFSKELFDLLTGSKKPELEVIDFVNNNNNNNNKKQSFLHSSPLSEYDKVSVNIGMVPVASFFYRDAKSASWRFDESPDFRESKIASLLWYKSKKGLIFIPLNFLLVDNEPVFLSFKLNNKTIRIPIGVVNANCSILGRLLLSDFQNIDTYLEKASFKYNGKLNKFLLYHKSNGKIEDIYIEVGEMTKERKILKGENNELLKDFVKRFINYRKKKKTRKILFKPILAEILSLRVKSEQSFTINDIMQDGTLDLILEKKDGHVSRYPIIFYKKVKAETSSFGDDYEGPLIPINRY